MPTHVSAVKRVRQSDKRKAVNQQIRTAMRTAIKQTRKAVEDGDVASATSLLLKAERTIASAAAKGILHQKNASRKISRIAKLVAKAKSKK